MAEIATLPIGSIITNFKKGLDAKGIKQEDGAEKRYARSIRYLLAADPSFKPEPVPRTAVKLRLGERTPRQYQKTLYTPTQSETMHRLLYHLHIEKLKFSEAWKKAKTPETGATQAAVSMLKPKPVAAFLFLAPGARFTEKAYDDLLPSGYVREIANLFGDYDLCIRLHASSLEELHNFFVGQTLAKKGRGKSKLFLATNSDDRGLFWFDGEDGPDLQKHPHMSLAYILVESKDNGLRFLRELKRERRQAIDEQSTEARTIAAASLCAGSADIIALAVAETTEELFDYIMKKYRRRPDVVQTITYLLKNSTYHVKPSNGTDAM